MGGGVAYRRRPGDPKGKEMKNLKTTAITAAIILAAFALAVSAVTVSDKNVSGGAKGDNKNVRRVGQASMEVASTVTSVFTREELQGTGAFALHVKNTGSNPLTDLDIYAEDADGSKLLELVDNEGELAGLDAVGCSDTLAASSVCSVYNESIPFGYLEVEAAAAANTVTNTRVILFEAMK